ncbi:NAD(P)-binding protein [Tilletiaria anomala UBC 951]|uniref:NAD(P)-binding protein n=1 Tax=Tilletiaria anomala (strain ATCC 24038 / CBS 436.72 / UBC 951) TaxID=1037660 RepID=A0A066VLS6_TILAU|nr:NAD(P)-binding protein [Tilletiaria anomala UBC 951]KDN41233.1 NAD(P)-binding protein [Tilletiaria anomala UBC 951]
MSRTETILITGAGGWLGSLLGPAIASLEPEKCFKFILADVHEPKHPADLTSEDEVERLFQTEMGRPDAVFAMHGPIRYVYVSATAVYGQPLPEVVLPMTACFPFGAYGTAKFMCEQLVTEYSRKGWIDGISVRPPTVVVRPGPPSRASSAFVSGIIREPLHGQQAICPVGSGMDDTETLKGTRVWVASSGITVRNIARAMKVDTSNMNAHSRAVELPGFTISLFEQIEALRQVAGHEAVSRIRFEPDETCRRLVTSWPASFDNSYALSMGFEVDTEGFIGCIMEYKAQYVA